MYLMMVIYETCSGHYIKYLRFYLNSDGQQLQQYQQNKHFTLSHWNKDIYDVVDPDPGLGQALYNNK